MKMHLISFFLRAKFEGNQIKCLMVFVSIRKEEKLESEENEQPFEGSYLRCNLLQIWYVFYPSTCTVNLVLFAPEITEL